MLNNLMRESHASSPFSDPALCHTHCAMPTSIKGWGL